MTGDPPPAVLLEACARFGVNAEDAKKLLGQIGGGWRKYKDQYRGTTEWQYVIEYRGPWKKEQ